MHKQSMRLPSYFISYQNEWLRYHEFLKEIDAVYSPLILQIFVINIYPASFSLIVSTTQEVILSVEVMLIGFIHIVMLGMVFMIFQSSAQFSKVVSGHDLCNSSNYILKHYKSLFQLRVSMVSFRNALISEKRSTLTL